MTRPVLSICIPTYNREALLLESLRALDAPGYLPFSFEVIVTDDSSPRDDYATVHAFRPTNYACEYTRFAKNLGLFPNLWGTLRRARGDYVIYLADDDQLHSDAVAAIVRSMQADPSIVATYAGWEGYDRVENRVVHPIPALEDSVVDRASASALIGRFIERQLIPEFGIYKTDALARCLFPSAVFFWGYLLIERLMRFGKIQLSHHVYYRAITRHPGDAHHRVTAGHHLAFEHWASMARGYALTRARFGAAGAPLPLPASGEQFQGDVPAAERFFQAKAFQLASADNRFLEAFDIALLLSGTTPLDALMEPGRHAGLAFGAAIDAVCQTRATLPDLDGLLLDGTFGPSHADIVRFVAGLPRGAGVTVGAYDGAAEPRRSLVLTANDAQRAARIADGHRPGFTFSLESLLRLFQL